MPSFVENADFIEKHRTDNVQQLALKLAGSKDVDVPYVLQQIEGWQRLRVKVPSWAEVSGLHYPPRLALEQCSGEAAALYKQAVARELVGDESGEMVDLTGGFGIDFSFLSRLFKRATYVERQEELCQAARHNFPLLGLASPQVVQADGVDFLRNIAGVDLIYLDPARRDTAGRKVFLPSDCSPDVVELLPLLLEKARFVMIKLSPMLDLAGAIKQLGCVSQAHIFSTAGECKDLLLVLQKNAEETDYFCKGNSFTFRFTQREEAAAQPDMAKDVEAYLYEPDAALLKAGAYRILSERFGVKKLHANSHLYTSDKLLPDFPGRHFKIETFDGFGKKELKSLLSGIEKANLTIRNFPATVADLRKRLKIKEGGDVYLFATTLADNRKVLIRCKKIEG